MTQHVTMMGPKLGEIQPETVVVGFPGGGLVGSIAARHIAYDLELEVVGYMRSPLIAPLVSYFDGVLAYPYRVYGSPDEPSVAVLVGENPLQEESVFYFAEAILNWASSVGTKNVVVVDGFTADEVQDDDSVFMVAEPDLLGTDKLEAIKKAIAFDEMSSLTGYIGGLPGALLNETIIRPLDGYALLASCPLPDRPNPAGAAAIIQALNQVLDVEVDVSGLLYEASQIESKLADLAVRTHGQTQHLGSSKTKLGLYR